MLWNRRSHTSAHEYDPDSRAGSHGAHPRRPPDRSSGPRPSRARKPRAGASSRSAGITSTSVGSSIPAPWVTRWRSSSEATGVGSGFAWPASLLLFALSTGYYLSLTLVFVAGLTQAIVWTVIATLILGNTAQPMRCRVMGLRTGVVIGLPLGNFLAGAVAERFGAPLAQGAYAASAIFVLLAIVLLVPSLKRLE